MERYSIGDVLLVWQNGNWLLHQDEFMECFAISEEESEWLQESITYKTEIDTMEKFVTGELLQKNGMYEMYQLPQGKFIVYHWATCRFAFGFWLESLERDQEVVYYIHPDMKNQIPLDAVRFFSCAGLHSKLLQKDALVFHASYINWNNNAILFAGHSGVGKSTQASLWERYAGAEIINGDRALIRKKDGKWYSYGYPCCGSSAICINKTLPLLAVVLLEQGEGNRVESLTMGQKIRMFLSGSEMYLWNTKEFDHVYEIAKVLCQEVLIFKLICRQDQDAVALLKHTLEEYGNGKNI